MPKELTTVTPLSKYLAMFLFIVLPFIGFSLGIRYQQVIDYYQEELTKPIPSIKYKTSTTDQTANWKTYANDKYKFQIGYPNNWNLVSSDDDYPIIRIENKSSSLAFYPYSNPDAGKINVNIVKNETISVGQEAIVFNYYISTVTKQISAYSNLRATTSIGKSFKTVNFYLNEENKENDLNTIKQILSTFRFEQALTTSKFLDNGNAVACTQDAKLCPDGSYVGRTEPNCEFAPCPN